MCKSSPAATSAQEEVLPWWGRAKGQRHCPLFHAHCSCPPDVCQQSACACFWVGVCQRAKIVLRKWKTNGLCLFSITAVQVMTRRPPKLAFFPLTYTVYIWRVCLCPSTLWSDQSQTLIPDREWSDDLTTAASGLPVPAAAGFSICGESVFCKSAHVKAAHSRACWWKLQCWSGDTTLHIHTYLGTHNITYTKQCVEIFVRRDHAHGDSVHGDYIHHRVQVKWSRESLQCGRS